MLDRCKGRVEGCRIWGNKGCGVDVKGSGSDAVVVGCKCARGRAGAVFLEALAF